MNVSNLMYVTNIIKIKFEIYNFLFNKLKEFFENKILFQIINEIQSREFFIQKDLINLIQKFTFSIKEQNNLLKNEFIKLNNDFLNTKEVSIIRTQLIITLTINNEIEILLPLYATTK